MTTAKISYSTIYRDLEASPIGQKCIANGDESDWGSCVITEATGDYIDELTVTGTLDEVLAQMDALVPMPTGLDVFTINDIADEVIHEIARRVQQRMGVMSGDGGGQFFSDDQHRLDIAQIVGDYADFEGAIRKNAKG